MTESHIAADRESQRVTRVNAVEEVDAYESSVGGVTVTGVRIGKGSGPNTVLSTAGDSFVANSIKMQFPMANRSSFSDSTVLAACVRSAPAGATWVGRDLDPGAVVLYGPGSEHTAMNPEGLEFDFVVTSVDDFARVADELQLAVKAPRRGQALFLDGTRGVRRFSRELSDLLSAAEHGVDPQENHEQDVLHQLANALVDPEVSERIGSERRIDDRVVTNASIEYAEAIERLPTLRELCRITHVSDRRLRQAFTDIYGCPPTTFFRTWGLNKAHEALAASDPSQSTVTWTAKRLGFAHLGRFAIRYKALYGESPSATLERIT